MTSSPRDPSPDMALEAPVALIRAGLDKIDQGITIFNQDLKLVFANAPLEIMMDFPAALLQPGANFEDLIRFLAERGEYGPGDVDRQVAERVSTARRFEPHVLERVRPNGAVLRISGWPLEQGGFATIYTDITDQKRREQTLESLVLSRTEDLRQNETRLRLIANEVPAGIAHLRLDQTFDFVNARFASAYGAEPDALIGRSAGDVLSPETMRVAHPYFMRASQGEPVDFDMTIKLRNRPALEVRTFLRPDGDPSSKDLGFYVLSVDVTKQKRAEAALATAQKMDAVGQLSSGVAHDFNNLLTVILGNLTPVAAELKRGGPAGEALAQDMLEPAIRAARRGAELTGRLLAVARRQPVAARPVEIGEAIKNLAHLVEASLPDRVHMELDLDGAPAWSLVDPTQLETALLNLAMNARDAIPPEAEGQVHIRLAKRKLDLNAASAVGLRAGDYVQITVRDNGVGVPPEAHDRIFEPFFSTKSDSGGSGLGLALVYSFARAAGGTISMKSAVGEGARFTLLLPASAPGLTEAEPSAQPIDAYDGRLLLLVEDDAEVRATLTRMLRDIGLAVLEAGNAEEALALLSRLSDVAFVLSDISMPGAISGFALAKQLATELPELPVVLMTAHGQDRFEGVDHVFLGPILRKPFDRSDLLKALAEASDAAARGKAT